MDINELSDLYGMDDCECILHAFCCILLHFVDFVYCNDRDHCQMNLLKVVGLKLIDMILDGVMNS